MEKHRFVSWADGAVGRVPLKFTGWQGDSDTIKKKQGVKARIGEKKRAQGKHGDEGKEW